MTLESIENLGSPEPQPGSLVISGSEDFDGQRDAALAVIEGVRASYNPKAPDRGYFPRGSSIVRDLYEHGANAGFYGERGIIVAGASSGHVASTFDHTPDKQHPFKRLVYTAQTLDDVFRGSRAVADTALARVQLGHSRVKGHLQEATAPHAAGTAYSAWDPNMILYTAANIGESLLGTHEALNGRLSERQRDDFCQDFSRFAELFGLERQRFPQTHHELQDYFDKLYDNGELHLTETARYIGEQILTNIPVPRLMRPVRQHVISPIIRGILPERTRELYGFSYDQHDEAAFRRAALLVRHATKIVPVDLRGDLIMRAFESVIKTEDKLVDDEQPHAVVPANPYK